MLPEVQLGRDEDKRFTWAAYACNFRLRLRVPVVVLVITIDPAVAAWTREPVSIGPGSGAFTAHVLGPEDIPRVADLDHARACPGLAVLSAMALASRVVDPQLQAEAALLAARAAFEAATDDRGLMYYDWVRSLLPEAARKVLDMLPQNYEFQDEGLRRALAEGRAEGEARGKAEAILAVLAARQVIVSESQRALVCAASDLATLDRWLAVAATCDDASALFQH